MSLPPVIFVTGTDTGVGKTVTTAALAVTLQGRGRSVAVYKPCQSGAAGGDSDVEEVRRLAGELHAEAGMVLEAPLAPVAAAALQGTNLPPIANHSVRIRELAAGHDHVLVEGAGGLLVALNSDGGTLASLASLLGRDAAFVTVARAGLGTLNHTALTLEALGARDLSVLGLVLGSWPDEPGPAEASNHAVLESQALKASGPPLLGSLPENAAGLQPHVFRETAGSWLKGLPE
ncbi:dethiobiotin synthase [Arthrobacter sp. ISL-30]|uniref:dethiobiotin synthase n=1 Tax=Arthrobacter sp. ISL-30 TaxID=2819109 RepID=UPI001BE95E6D|nr:dethiobiotin synthase [Arthrobacter sp. ISL-30]MBT2515258.1 dethiobiotin synthase [Arthrobacter sp. ISL-30]